MKELTRTETVGLAQWIGEMAEKARKSEKKDMAERLDKIRIILEDVAIYFGTTEKRIVSIKEADVDPSVKAVVDRMKKYEGSVDLDHAEICPYSPDGIYCGPCRVNELPPNAPASDVNNPYRGCFTIDGSGRIFMCITTAARRMHVPRRDFSHTKRD